MTKGEFAGYMAKLVAAYREQIDEPTLEVYYERFREYEPHVLHLAVNEAIDDLPRFPSVAELRSRVLRIRREHQEQVPRLRPAPPDRPLPVKELVAELREKMGWR